jgi:hypothetical protein
MKDRYDSSAVIAAPHMPPYPGFLSLPMLHILAQPHAVTVTRRRRKHRLHLLRTNPSDITGQLVVAHPIQVLRSIRIITNTRYDGYAQIARSSRSPAQYTVPFAHGPACDAVKACCWPPNVRRSSALVHYNFWGVSNFCSHMDLFRYCKALTVVSQLRALLPCLYKVAPS